MLLSGTKFSESGRETWETDDATARMDLKEMPNTPRLARKVARFMIGTSPRAIRSEDIPKRLLEMQ